MPRDFLSEDDSSTFTPEKSGRDYLNENSSKESLGTSAFLAAPRILEDIYKNVVKGVQNIPQYYESGKTEIPGVMGSIKNHPGSALKQAGAGLAELGQNIFNTPHDIINYGSNRLNLIPKEFNEKVQMARMPESSFEINKTFGEPKYPGEKLIRGGVRNALNVAGVGKASSILNPMNLTAGSIAKDVVRTGERNKKSSSKQYKSLFKEAENKKFKDISSIISKLDVDTIKKYTPKKKITYLEDFINSPSLETAHNAKSDLLRIQRDLSKKSTLAGAEKKQYKAVSDAIGEIQNNMFKKSSGKTDKTFLNKYMNLQQGYAKNVVPYKNKSIGKFKRNEISAKELVNALSHGEFMAKKGSSHKAIGLRGKVLPFGLGISGLTLGRSLYNDLMGNEVVEQ